jgi:hypothetical protein
MIVFVNVSPRRTLVLEVHPREDAYYAAEAKDSSEVHKGYLVANAKLITPDPVSWPKARRAATNYARERGLLVDFVKWQSTLAARKP